MYLDFGRSEKYLITVRLGPACLRQQQASGRNKKQVMEEKNLIYWAEECCLQLNTNKLALSLMYLILLTIINWKSPLPRGTI